METMARLNEIKVVVDGHQCAASFFSQQTALEFAREIQSHTVCRLDGISKDAH